MKRSARIALMLAGTVIALQGATRSDISILEASERIKYVSQEMAEEYAYYYAHQHKKEYHRAAQAAIGVLEANMRTLARTTKANNIRQMLDFFSYEKEQLKSVLQEQPSRQNAVEVLDSSEAFAEGAAKIAAWVKYDFTHEEQMFMTCNRINYLLKKLSKYYIVFGSDIDTISLREKMDADIVALESELNKIRTYTYPSDYNGQKEQLMKLWAFSKTFYVQGAEGRMPGVLMIVEQGIAKIADELAAFHSKNQ